MFLFGGGQGKADIRNPLRYLLMNAVASRSVSGSFQLPRLGWFLSDSIEMAEPESLFKRVLRFFFSVMGDRTDTEPVYFHRIRDFDHQIGLTVDNLGFYQIGALRIDLNHDVGSLDFKLSLLFCGIFSSSSGNEL